MRIAIWKGMCVDATLALKKALQQLREQGQDAHVLFIDLVKAYNSVVKQSRTTTMENSDQIWSARRNDHSFEEATYQYEVPPMSWKRKK